MEGFRPIGKVDELGRVQLAEEQCNALQFKAHDSIKLTVANGCISLEKAVEEQAQAGGEYIIRKIDDLHQIVLPKSYRTMLYIETGDRLYSYTESPCMFLCKMQNKPVCRICGGTDHLFVLTSEQCACRDCLLQALSRT